MLYDAIISMIVGISLILLLDNPVINQINIYELAIILLFLISITFVNFIIMVNKY